MDMSLLDQFRLTVQEHNYNPYGIVVYKKGSGMLCHRWRSDDRENIYSGGKTFASIAIGICRDEGRLSLTDKVLDFFPEYKSVASDGTEKITIRDLLHMASGKIVNWYSDAEPEMDFLERFFREKLDFQPGEHFFYSNLCTYTLGRIVEKTSGEILRNYLITRLFLPLRILNPLWHTCPMGHTEAATNFFVTTGEFANLAIMMLHEGVFNDRQIVSSSYIHESFTDVITNDYSGLPDIENRVGYGYQLWQCTIPGYYRAEGMYGQFNVIVPEKGVVVTLTSHEERVPNNLLRAIFTDIISIL